MAHRIDIHVGKKLRQRRWHLDATQKQVAEEVGIRYQQLQKYETGVNRMSVSRLWEVAEALQVPVSYFFDDLPHDRRDGDTAQDSVETSKIGEKEAAEVVRAFSEIPTAERKRLLEIAHALRGPRDD